MAMTGPSQRILVASVDLLICRFMVGSLIRTERRRFGSRAEVIGTVIGPALSRDDGVEMNAAIIGYDVDDREFKVVDNTWRPSRTPQEGVKARLLYPMGQPQFAYRP
jgi:hypothetical protein